MKYFPAFLASLMLLLPQTSLLAAGSSSAPAPLPAAACIAQTENRLAQQQRIYRAILFGRQSAAHEPMNNTRYDQDGNAWIKVGDSNWRTAAPGYEGTTWSDGQINGHTEWEGLNETVNVSPRAPRLGIFAQTGATTSQLIPGILQAFRALRCRLAMVCHGIRATQLSAPAADGTLTVTTPGCAPLKLRPLSSCKITQGINGAQQAQATLDSFSQTVIAQQCNPMAQSIAAREEQMLKLAVSYDAGYRSLLQFSGNFDRFLGQFRGDLLSPIQDAMPLISQLSRIPCFLSQCSR